MQEQTVDLVQKADTLIDDFVKRNKQASETTEQAYSRLARESEQFAKLYAHAQECRALL